MTVSASSALRRIPRRVAVAAMVVAGLAGCGQSPLIRRDDDTYRRSIEHFQRTRQLIAASLAPDEDQAIFEQAEGVFRYRFEPPGRSAGAYLVQATASFIDLPVLEAVAGALDLYSLRLRANDAAVQLWETLLDRAPATPLRPLTLYRLGWAYRNAIAPGLPRSSALAFDELAAKFPGSALAALAAEARRLPYKSQGAATAWSIVPGLGQMYTGHYASGAVRLAIAAAAATAIIVPGVRAYQRGSDFSLRHDWPLIAVAVAGAAVLAIDYSSSYQDALATALEHNERAEAAFEASHPTAP
ncbi:MAG TPA: hypothetical protein VH165_33070 [Kofleriaceae bacterium]|nr:hypothetical protein [Kofleriaceae bacterium]